MNITTKLAALALLAAGTLCAQGTGAGAAANDGIPVTSQLVVQKCGTCHKKDDAGRLSRISYSRSTPEGWEEAIKRMVRLNGLTLTPAEAKSVLKYLSTNHGLSPEEAKPMMYMAEHRLIDENVPNESVKGMCTACHAVGRGLTWRRTKDDWKLLTNMHVFLYPQAEQTFRAGCPANNAPCNAARQQAGLGGGGGRGGAAAVPATQQPVEEAVDWLGKNAGLQSESWSAWSARMRAPKLTGRWLISAHIVGKGNYSGEMVVGQGPAEDEFTTKVTLTSLTDGSKIERTGSGLVYAGYSWRGRSKGNAAATAAPDDLGREMREAVWYSPDQSSGEGRWFWGEYQEFGIDVKLKRASTEPSVMLLTKASLKSGTTAQRIRILGDAFPGDASAADLDFGPGVTVKSLVSKSASELVVDVDVAANAMAGKRDVAFRRSILQGAYAIYDRVDYIKITPDAATARLGSDVHPKGFMQFEAVGYHRGADGKAGTADDVELGNIEVNWTTEEFLSQFSDDDREFVGSLSSTGFFTPSIDGPNPARKDSRNNYGNIWVVGTAKNEKDKDGKPLVGKSYLVVTVPMYIRWDQPEVGQ